MMRASVLLCAAVVAAGAVCCARSQSDSLLPCQVRIAPRITRVTGMNFDPGDKIGLSIRTSGGSYLDNRLLTFDGTVFAGTGVIWYNDLNEPSTLTAYYPYCESGIPTLFNVASDQSGEGFPASDLLAATRSEVLPGATPVEMVFRHLMTKLLIEVTNRSDARITQVTIGGSILEADVDLDGLATTVRSGEAGTIRAHTAVAESLYEAVVVPQTVALTVGITTDDGKSRTETLASSPLLAGSIYTIEVSFSNIDIDVSVSGQITDWIDGGTLPSDNGNSDPSNDGEISHGGANYRTVKLRDGRIWMASNLYCVPQGAAASSDPAEETGVWYPCDASAIPSREESFVASQGLLYELETVLGVTPSAEEPNRTEGVRGICPEGWHVPTISEFEALIAAYDTCGDELVDFVTMGGIRSVAGSSAKYSAMAPTGSFTKGYFSGSSASDGFVDGKYLHLCCDNTSGTIQLSVVPLAVACGLPVRCVKDK